MRGWVPPRGEDTSYLPIKSFLLSLRILLCSVVFPALPLCSKAFPPLPCRPRPHHTSNLQNPFFPFNVGEGGGGAEDQGVRRPQGRV